MSEHEEQGGTTDEMPEMLDEMGVEGETPEATGAADVGAESEGASPPEELPEDLEARAGAEEGELLPKIDLNTASKEELQQLPGIGETLAARIVNYRVEVNPFRDPAEIMAVPGVAEDTYARLAGRLTVSAVEPVVAAEPEPAEPEEELEGETRLPEAEVEVAEAVEPEAVEPAPVEPEAVEPGAVEPEAEAVPEMRKPPRGPEPPLVEVVQARVGWGRFLFIGLLSAILGAVLALVFLYMVNGTLDFQAATGRVVRSEVQRLEGEIDALNARLDQAEAALQALEELDSRLTGAEANLQKLAGDLAAIQGDVESMAGTVDALRQEFTNLREDLDGLAEHQSRLEGRLASMEEGLAVLSQDIEVLQQNSRRFNAFLDGLRELLGDSEGTLRPTPTLRITPAESPTPRGTPTLRPKVTVIPLASPTPTP